MKVSDLIKNTSHPDAGIGIKIEVGAPQPEPDYVIAVFPEHGQQIAYQDEIEVISELSDEQLEQVHGGMSPSAFALWKMETLNESR